MAGAKDRRGGQGRLNFTEARERADRLKKINASIARRESKRRQILGGDTEQNRKALADLYTEKYKIENELERYRKAGEKSSAKKRQREKRLKLSLKMAARSDMS